MKMPPPNEIISQLRDFWRGLKREQKIAIIGIVFIVFASLIGLIYYTNRIEWGLLYRGLPEENAAKVIEFLKQEKIPYQVTNGGTIRIPKEHVPEVRMELASKGIIGPQVEGFELFDRSQLGTTDFLQRVNYQRALEGELSRTISSLKEIDFARVHLALPRESLFIEEEKPPKASVFLKLKPGTRLSRREIQGIVNLVASAVSGLSPENVTVVDTSGKVLYQEPSPEERLNEEQLAYRRHLEEAYKEKIERLLAQALGPEHAIAQVSVDVDFTKEAITEDIYDPEGTAIRSELTEEQQKEGTSPGGIPGAKGALANKIEGNTTGTSQTQREFRRSITRNYEVSHISKHTQLEPGNIKRISVAVLVDSSVLNSTGKKGEVKASEDRLSLVERLVKGAIAYNPDRGDQVEVVSLPFKGLPKEIKTNIWLEYASRLARPVSEFLLILLFILLVIRPVLKIFLGKMVPEKEEEVLPEEEEEEKPEAIKAEEVIPLPQEVALGIIQNRPDRAAVLVKKWLAEESEEQRRKIIKEAEKHASA